MSKYLDYVGLTYYDSKVKAYIKNVTDVITITSIGGVPNIVWQDETSNFVPFVYGKNSSNENTKVQLSVATLANTVPLRDGNGRVKTSDGVAADDSTNKRQLDALSELKQDKLTAGDNIAIVDNIISARFEIKIEIGII